jgi:hypothetical protein
MTDAAPKELGSKVKWWPRKKKKEPQHQEPLSDREILEITAKWDTRAWNLLYSTMMQAMARAIIELQDKND